MKKIIKLLFLISKYFYLPQMKWKQNQSPVLALWNLTTLIMFFFFFIYIIYLYNYIFSIWLHVLDLLTFWHDAVLSSGKNTKLALKIKIDKLYFLSNPPGCTEWIDIRRCSGFSIRTHPPYRCALTGTLFLKGLEALADWLKAVMCSEQLFLLWQIFLPFFLNYFKIKISSFFISVLFFMLIIIYI